MRFIDAILAWLDRLGAWPWVLGAAAVAGGYVTGVIGLAAGFPLPLQLSIYLGSASLAIGVTRSLLRRLQSPHPDLVISGSVGEAFVRFNTRVGDFAWITVRNDADTPSGDAVDVFGSVTVLDSDGAVVIPAYLARWRDSPEPSAVLGAGEITDRQPIRAAGFRQFDVAFRYKDEPVAHALNTDAMQYPDWIKPTWELRAGAYRVRLRISGGNMKPADAWFTLINHEAGPLAFEAETRS